MDTVKLNPDMPQENKCPQCGTPLPAGTLAGLCPACLLAQGAAEDTATEGRQPAFTPPAIPELVPLFPQLEILELIGKGGMGAVYKARQKQLDRVVALKILPPGIGDDLAFAERFAREAKALAKLNHPGIVTLYEFGRADLPVGPDIRAAQQPGPTSQLYFFLMEFVDGVNLRQLLHNGRVSPREALAIVPQICDALQFAHDQGIVHRDIKPENILLDRRGRVKVADFGLAKIVGSDSPLTPSLSPSDGERVAKPGEGMPTLTDVGKIMGTPNYMAPEQAERPAEVDHRADIYALGVVFYQMLTGELPGKQLQPPSQKVQIDVRLDEVVLRALEKKPELRYQQASGLKTAVETISTSERFDAAASPAAKRPRRVRVRHVLTAIGTGLFVGMAAFIITAILTALLPDSFQATTRLKVDRLVPAGVNQPQAALAQYDPYEIQTEMAIIQSEPVLKRVVEALNLSATWERRYAGGEKLQLSKTLDLLKQRLLLRPIRNTSLIEISVFSEIPTEAAELANAIADSYAEYRRQQVRAYLESAKSKSATELAVSGEPQLRQVQIIDRAVPPVRPIRPNRPVNLFIGALIGLVLVVVVSVGTFLWLYLWQRNRRDSDQEKPDRPALTASSEEKPWFAFGAAFTFAGTLMAAFLCELFLGYVLGKWIIGMLLLVACATVVLIFLLRRFTTPELQRVGFKLAAWLAFLAALPIIGFAAFFLFAMTQEGFGWNPAVDEAVTVPLIWLGAFMLPICGLRLWRAANVTTPATTAPVDKGGPMDSGGRWSWRSLRVADIGVAAGLIWIAVFGGIWLMSFQGGPRHEVHYRLFEVESAVADELVPTAQRQIGATGNWQMADISPETLAALLDGRVLGHVMMDRRLVVRTSRSSSTTVVSKKPGAKEDRRQEVVGWPIVADSSGHSLANHVSNDIAKVSAHGFFGVRRKDGVLQLKIGRVVTHKIGDRPAVDVNIAYEGSAPQNGALAFFIPFARKDDTTGYFLLTVEVHDVATKGRLTKQASTFVKDLAAGQSKPVLVGGNFGPVIERVITLGEVGADGLIFVNLEKAEVLPPPFHLTVKPFDSGLFERTARIEEWIAGSGADLALQLKDNNWAFTPLGTRLMYRPNDTTEEDFLNAITPAEAEAILTNPRARKGYIASLGGGVSAYPVNMNYLFKTRTGTTGLLRLDGSTNEVNAVKLSFRLASETNAAASGSKRQRFEPKAGMAEQTSWTVLDRPSVFNPKGWAIMARMTVGGVVPARRPGETNDFCRILMPEGNDNEITLKIEDVSAKSVLTVKLNRDEHAEILVDGRGYRVAYLSADVALDQPDTMPFAIVIVTEAGDGGSGQVIQRTVIKPVPPEAATALREWGDYVRSKTVRELADPDVSEEAAARQERLAALLRGTTAGPLWEQMEHAGKEARRAYGRGDDTEYQRWLKVQESLGEQLKALILQ